MQKYIAVVLAVSIAAACSDKTANDIDHASHSSNATNSNGHLNHTSMEHSAMTSSPGAASAPIELQFLDTMIIHHKGAIDMAKLADARAEHAELKKLSSDILRDQEREIATMNQLRGKWFGENPEALNMEFPGMSEGMHGMDLKKLESLRGNDFDVEFIRQMIPHHQGAIAMAKHLASNASHAELKTLADDIIKAQEAEVKQMGEWLQAWK